MYCQDLIVPSSSYSFGRDCRLESSSCSRCCGMTLVLHRLIAVCCMGFWQIDPSLSVVVCGLVVFLSGALWFVVFACLPCSPERAVVVSFWLAPGSLWKGLRRLSPPTSWVGCGEGGSLLSLIPGTQGQPFISEGKGQHSVQSSVFLTPKRPLHWGLLCFFLIFLGILRWSQKINNVCLIETWAKRNKLIVAILDGHTCWPHPWS